MKNELLSMALSQKFSPQSKVWIFTIVEPILEEKENQINEKLNFFVQNWVSHSNALNSRGFILFHRFIVLLVDETHFGASGCSIDKALRFIQTLEIDFDISLLNRSQLTYVDLNNNLKGISQYELSSAIKNGELSLDTMFCNVLVNTLYELENQFFVKLSDSWMIKVT